MVKIRSVRPSGAKRTAFQVAALGAAAALVVPALALGSAVPASAATAEPTSLLALNDTGIHLANAQNVVTFVNGSPNDLTFLGILTDSKGNKLNTSSNPAAVGLCNQFNVCTNMPMSGFAPVAVGSATPTINVIYTVKFKGGTFGGVNYAASQTAPFNVTVVPNIAVVPGIGSLSATFTTWSNKTVVLQQRQPNGSWLAVLSAKTNAQGQVLFGALPLGAYRMGILVPSIFYPGGVLPYYSGAFWSRPVPNNGPALAPLAQAPRLAATRFTLGADDTTANYGDPATLTSTLTSGATNVAGVPVDMCTFTNFLWNCAPAGSTNAKGQVETQVTPKVFSEYHFHFTGNGTYQAADSNIAQVIPNAPKTLPVALATLPATIPVGSSFVIGLGALLTVVDAANFNFAANAPVTSCLVGQTAPPGPCHSLTSAAALIPGFQLLVEGWAPFNPTKTTTWTLTHNADQAGQASTASKTLDVSPGIALTKVGTTSIDAQTTPAAAFTLFLQKQNGTNWTTVETRVANAAGLAHFTVVPAGTYQVISKATTTLVSGTSASIVMP